MLRCPLFTQKNENVKLKPEFEKGPFLQILLFSTDRSTSTVQY